MSSAEIQYSNSSKWINGMLNVSVKLLFCNSSGFEPKITLWRDLMPIPRIPGANYGRKDLIG